MDLMYANYFKFKENNGLVSLSFSLTSVIISANKSSVQIITGCIGGDGRGDRRMMRDKKGAKNQVFCKCFLCFHYFQGLTIFRS